MKLKGILSRMGNMIIKEMELPKKINKKRHFHLKLLTLMKIQLLLITQSTNRSSKHPHFMKIIMLLKMLMMRILIMESL